MAAVTVDECRDGDVLVDVLVDDMVDDETRVARRRVLRPFVARVVSLPTRVELLSALTGLTGRGDLSARELVETAVAWKRMIGFCTAAQFSVVGDPHRERNPQLAGPGADPGGVSAGGVRSPVRRTADELAPALGIAPRAASRLVGLTCRLEQTLPAAFDALAEGRSAGPAPAQP